MTLSDKQARFVELVVKDLIPKAWELGFRVRLGEAWRTDAQAALYAMGENGRSCAAEALRAAGYPSLAVAIEKIGAAKGIVNSLHRDRLAVDLVLDWHGAPCWDPEVIEPLGLYWESLDGPCRWGGRFSDSCHFSYSDGGRA